MPLDGYDNVVQVGLVQAGLLDPDPGYQEGGSILFDVMTPGLNVNRVELRGRAMPYQEVEWGITQRIEKTNYSGSVTASQQVIGPVDDDTKFEGEWKARYLPNSVFRDGVALSADPRDTVNLFRDLARVGAILRVTWNGIVRTGIISEFTPSWKRPTDVLWSLTFSWHSSDDDDDLTLKYQDVNTAGPDALGKLNEFLDTVAIAPLVGRQLVAMAVSDIRAVQETASKIIALIGSVEILTSVPATTLGAIKSAAAQLEREAQIMVRRVSSSLQSSASAYGDASITVRTNARSVVPAQSQAVGTEDYNPPAGIPTETAEALANGISDPTASASGYAIAASNQSVNTSQPGPSINSYNQTPNVMATQFSTDAWRRTVTNNINGFMSTVWDAIENLEERSQPGGYDTITSRDGDTLYSISNQYFGSPDYANWIAVTNGLDSAIIEPGTVIYIPRRAPGASEDQEVVRGPQLGPTGEL